MDDTEVLIFTYKNIGINYLALGQSGEGEIFFNKALRVVKEMKDSLVAEEEKDEGYDEQLKVINEQFGSIYFDLYLAAIQRGDKQRAYEQNL